MWLISESHLLYPEKAQATSRKIPDGKYIHRELAKEWRNPKPTLERVL